MLSKILRGKDAEVSRPILWRSARTVPPAAGSRIPVAGTQQPLPSESRQVIAMDADSPDLRLRIQELERALEHRVAEARASGYREGELAGRTQAEAQVQPVLQSLATSIQDISKFRGELRHQAEGDLLKLALAIAKKILHRELQSDPEALSGLIRVALDKIRVQEILRVRAHPQHTAFLQEAIKRLISGMTIDVVPDQRLPVGGVIVETTRGNFDASIDVQLREIERGLADRLGSRTTLPVERQRA